MREPGYQDCRNALWAGAAPRPRRPMKGTAEAPHGGGARSSSEGRLDDASNTDRGGVPGSIGLWIGELDENSERFR